jgi:hypothetical protein
MRRILLSAVTQYDGGRDRGHGAHLGVGPLGRSPAPVTLVLESHSPGELTTLRLRPREEGS